MIVEAFLANKNHWNQSLTEYKQEAMDIFKLRDTKTFNKIREKCELERERKQRASISKIRGSNNNDNMEKQQRMEKWRRIKAMAQQKTASK